MQHDILPVQACFNCVSTVMSWHNLFLTCQEADHKFQTMLGAKNQYVVIKFLHTF